MEGFSAISGELPWRENRSNISCIPTGEYRVRWGYSPHFKKWKYQILNVPKRYGVLMHAASYMGDTSLGFKTHLQGCIALSEKIGTIEKQKALLLSFPAMRRFEELLNKQEFTLRISNEY